MGVPITFLNDYSPDQFKIMGVSHELAIAKDFIREWDGKRTGSDAFYIRQGDGYRRLYDRIVIRRSDNPNNPQKGGDE